MGAQAAVKVCSVFAFGEQGAAVAVSAQRLGREEAGRGRVGLAAEHLAVQGGAETLCEIVQQEQIFRPGDVGQGGPVGGLAEKVDSDDRARRQHRSRPSRFNPLRQMGRVDLESARVHVHEHRRGTQHQRHLGGRGIGERGQEDRIAAADVLGHQSDHQGIGAGADADAMFRAAEACQLAFQFAHLGAKDELAVLQDGIQAAAQIDRDAGLLRLEVEERE